MHNVWNTLATLGPIGYLPASGTCASLVTLVVLWYVQASFPLSLLMFLLATLGALVIIHKSLPLYKEKDPSCIVIDEVIGTMVAVWGIPRSMLAYSVAFLLFRFLDITKPFFIAYAENLPGCWGILADDIVAGLLAGVITYIMLSWLIF